MFIRPIFLLVLVATLVNGAGESLSIRQLERSLSEALNAKDKAALLTLADKGFHVNWQCGSAVHSFDLTVPLQGWIDDVTQLHIDSYRANVSKVYFPSVHRPDPELAGTISMAQATVDEFWIIHSPDGTRMEKHFLATDAWVKPGVKAQDTWKLAARIYSPKSCPDSEHYWLSPY